MGTMQQKQKGESRLESVSEKEGHACGRNCGSPTSTFVRMYVQGCKSTKGIESNNLRWWPCTTRRKATLCSSPPHVIALRFPFP